MKVNVYEPDNVQKGRLMLLNLAEDLKEYSKVKVGPGTGSEKVNKDEKKKETKNNTVETIKDMAEK
jgi:hypothetical protein